MRMSSYQRDSTYRFLVDVLDDKVARDGIFDGVDDRLVARQYSQFVVSANAHHQNVAVSKSNDKNSNNKNEYDNNDW